jgi:hypothetical protein
MAREQILHSGQTPNRDDRPSRGHLRAGAVWAGPEATARWRRNQRLDDLRVLNARAASLRWTPTLLKALLEELHVDDAFEGLVGRPARLSVEQYPQAVALAIALKHSWRPDDLQRIARRLGLNRGD